jgi:hypothetical protein
MKPFWIALALPIGSCVSGDFCEVYTPLDMNREAAAAVIQLDRPAAEAIAVNETVWRNCIGPLG